MTSEMGASLSFAALFAAVFAAIDHRLQARFTWQSSSRIDVERIKKQAADGTPRRRIAFLALLAAAVLWEIFLPSRVELRHAPLAGLVCAWIFWEACSVAWSANRRLSLRSVIPWLITAGVGFTVGNQLGLYGSVPVVALVCAAFLIAGVANERLPGERDPPSGYRFAGTLHPNQQGVNCALLAFSCCWMGLTHEAPFAIAAAGTALGIAGLLLTRSRSGSYAALAASLVWAVFTPPGAGRAWTLGLAASIFLGTLAAGRFLGPPFSEEDGAGRFDSMLLFGRGEYAGSLNGRTLLWRFVIAETKPRWIRGHGFGSFWNARRMEAIREEYGLVVWSSHSALFEIFTRSGIVGAILFAATLFAAIFTALASYDATGGIFLGSLFVFIALDGLLENFFVAPSFPSLCLFLFLGALSAS